MVLFVLVLVSSSYNSSIVVEVVVCNCLPHHNSHSNEEVGRERILIILNPPFERIGSVSVLCPFAISWVGSNPPHPR